MAVEIIRDFFAGDFRFKISDEICVSLRGFTDDFLQGFFLWIIGENFGKEKGCIYYVISDKICVSITGNLDKFLQGFIKKNLGLMRLLEKILERTVFITNPLMKLSKS